MNDCNKVDSLSNTAIHNNLSGFDETHKIKGNDKLFLKCCSNLCSMINLDSNSAAMSQYFNRLQPSSIPYEIQEFLKSHTINIDKNQSKLNNDKIMERSETQSSSGVNQTILHNSKVSVPQMELKELNLTVQEPEKKYECNVCGICLKRKEHLDQHKRGHSEGRPFVCDICFKGFKRNEHLRRHSAIHSGTKCHLCVDCGKAFSRKDHLNKHLLTHVSKRTKPELNESKPISQYTHSNK